MTTHTDRQPSISSMILSSGGTAVPTTPPAVMMIAMARDPRDDNKISTKIVANRNGDEGAEVGPLTNGFMYGVLTENIARPDLLVAEALVPDIDKGIFD